MVVLIDTNVIIDFLMTREPFYKASSEIIDKCSRKELLGYIAFHSLTNLWYILRKVPEDLRREWIIFYIFRDKGDYSGRLVEAAS